MVISNLIPAGFTAHPTPKTPKDYQIEMYKGKQIHSVQGKKTTMQHSV
jgi:hypothetical protein